MLKEALRKADGVGSCLSAWVKGFGVLLSMFFVQVRELWSGLSQCSQLVRAIACICLPVLGTAVFAYVFFYIQRATSVRPIERLNRTPVHDQPGRVSRLPSLPAPRAQHAETRVERVTAGSRTTPSRGRGWPCSTQCAAS